MNKDLKITLGLIAVTAVAYHLWKMSQSKPKATAENNTPAPKMPIGDIMDAPKTNFASYVNMTNNVKGGGFFQSEKVKLNY